MAYTKEQWNQLKNTIKKKEKNRKKKLQRFQEENKKDHQIKLCL